MSFAKSKGYRFEKEVADTLTNSGIDAERVPLSGSFGGKYDCDVVIGTPEQPKAKIEAKYRENINKDIWVWLKGNDFLALRRNKHKALIVMDIDKFIELYKAAHKENE